MSCFSTEELFEIVFYPLNFFNWISLISSLLFRYSIFKEHLSLSDIWSHWVLLVEMRRIELLTPCLQSRCSPSWAKPPSRANPYVSPLPLVGWKGLEPSTSRLSAVCSNQLSSQPESSSSLKIEQYFLNTLNFALSSEPSCSVLFLP